MHIWRLLDKRWLERWINYVSSSKSHEVNHSLSSNCSASTFFPLVIIHHYSSGTEWQIRLDGSFVPSSSRCPKTFRISMPTYTPVHHKHNTLLIQSNGWWWLLTIKKFSSASNIIRCLNTLYPKSLLLCLHEECQEASSNVFFSLQNEIQPWTWKSYNIQVQRHIKKSLQEISLVLLCQSVKAGYLMNLQHWLNANSKLNDLVSRRAQLEETGRVSSSKNPFSGLKIKGALYPDHVTVALRGFHASRLLHVVIFSAVIWPDSVLQTSLSTSSSNLLKCIRARVRAVARREKDKTNKKKKTLLCFSHMVHYQPCVCVCVCVI